MNILPQWRGIWSNEAILNADTKSDVLAWIDSSRRAYIDGCMFRGAINEMAQPGIIGISINQTNISLSSATRKQFDYSINKISFNPNLSTSRKKERFVLINLEIYKQLRACEKFVSITKIFYCNIVNQNVCSYKYLMKHSRCWSIYLYIRSALWLTIHPYIYLIWTRRTIIMIDLVLELSA